LKNNSLPFFADASIVSNYRLLFKYWEIVREDRDLFEKAFLNKSDFDYLKEIVETMPGIDVASLLNMLVNRFIDRVNCEKAYRAYIETYGLNIDEKDACREVARILAGWLIEAGRNTGILKYKYSWKKGE